MLTFTLIQASQLCFAAMAMILEGEATDFSGLGKLMLGGFVLAVGIAITFTFIRLRLRDKKPAPPQFISISSLTKKED